VLLLQKQKLVPKKWNQNYLDEQEQNWLKFQKKSSLASKNDPFLVENRPKTTIFWRRRRQKIKFVRGRSPGMAYGPPTLEKDFCGHFGYIHDPTLEKDFCGHFGYIHDPTLEKDFCGHFGYISL
jgi:hypothetical protein